MTSLGGPQAGPGEFGEGDVLYTDPHLRVVWSTADSSLLLNGELDVSNSDAVGTALAHVRGGSGPVVVDTGGLRFVDLAGLRALLAPGPLGGPSVRLRNVPPYLRRLLDILGQPA
ncbi:STAS domain-containing protein [Microbispora sp. ATCC PTA-5024]|uniref:STAS domain-containing protein n=1 Tax=Microbispora sp. ATCC PTA-5024 TaxID=316330 RepID=UPI0003DD38FD|nr:STAS domain-containing protein [Microbispora sp. ATCC PTA-5024]ETK34936.1 anti-sigma factor antagonist [Microbispora sp. ATCC PTA-5024]